MELRPYQKIGIQYLLNHRRALLGDEPGLGKTAQALIALDNAQGYPALVVCPASVKTHWANQCLQWLGRTAKIINTGKDLLDESAAITICNYELLKTVYRRGTFCTLIVDELFKCKNEQAQRTRHVLDLARRAQVVWGLSGSPIVNRPLELVSQLDILGQLHHFGDKWRFVWRYCNPIQREIWVPRYNYQQRKVIRTCQRFLDCTGQANIGELHQRLKDLCMLRRLKSQVAKELPERQSLPLMIDLDPAGRKLYDDERRALMNWLHQNKGNIRTQQPEALMRLTQMRQTAARAKLARLCEWIEDLLENGEKVVLYAFSRCLQQDLLQHFADRAAHVLSDDSLIQRQTQIDNFVHDPRLVVCVCSLMATAIGTDGLQHAARYAVFCDLGNESETHQQAIDRLHRIGQSRDVTAYYAVAVNTIEEEMLDRLIFKHTVASIVANGQVVRELLEAA